MFNKAYDTVSGKQQAPSECLLNKELKEEDLMKIVFLKTFFGPTVMVHWLIFLLQELRFYIGTGLGPRCSRWKSQKQWNRKQTILPITPNENTVDFYNEWRLKYLQVTWNSLSPNNCWQGGGKRWREGKIFPLEWFLKNGVQVKVMFNQASRPWKCL